MALTDKLASDITSIFGTAWNVREGRVVPATEDVALTNGAVRLDATMLYADLASSTTLARKFDSSTVAKIVKAYLSTMTQLVKAFGGEVRSFDGDRVMGVFVGNSKNTSAAKCALKMNWVMSKLLRPRAEVSFPALRQQGFVLQHGVGIHSSEVLVVRGGVRGSNDLVFVGAAPNLAAKLSEVRDGYESHITYVVYSMLHDESKLAADGRNMWTAVKCRLGGEVWDCYRSGWIWAP